MEAERESCTDERDSWLCRSTVGACSEVHSSRSDLDDDSDVEQEIGTLDESANTKDELSCIDLKVVGTINANTNCLDLNCFSNQFALQKHLPMVEQTSPSKKRKIPTFLTQSKSTMEWKKRDECLQQYTILMDPCVKVDLVSRELMSAAPSSSLSLPNCFVYLIVFNSTAVAHTAALQSKIPLRDYFGLTHLPFSAVPLVFSIGLALFCALGAAVGAVSGDRWTVCKMSTPFWILSILLLHIDAVKEDPPPILHSLGLFGSAIAHGILASSMFMLGIQCSYSRFRYQDMTAQQHDRFRFVGSYVSAVIAGSLAGQLPLVAIPASHRVLSAPSQGTKRRRLAGTPFLMALSLSLLILLAIFHCFVHRKRAGFSKHSLSTLSRPVRSPTSSSSVPFQMLLHRLRDVSHRSRGALVLWISLTLMFVGMSLGIVSQVVPTILSLVALSILVVGWLTVLLVGMSQLERAKCMYNSSGAPIPISHLYGVISALLLLCASMVASFIQAQVYLAFVAQVCQMSLVVPFTTVVFAPDALPLVSMVGSLISMPLIFRVPSLKSRSSPYLSRITRAMRLYLLVLFMSSIVELYRRSRQPLDRKNALQLGNYGKLATSLGVLWTLPHVLLLGVVTLYFRVNLLVKLFTLCHREQSESPHYGYFGLVLAGVFLSESFGGSIGLVMSSTLSPWLFAQQQSDLAILLLLFTSFTCTFYVVMKHYAPKLATWRYN